MVKLLELLFFGKHNKQYLKINRKTNEIFKSYLRELNEFLGTDYIVVQTEDITSQILN